MNKLVSFDNNQPTTTTLIIAEHFSKRHDNVLRDIESLIEDMTCGGLLKIEESSTSQELQGPQELSTGVIHSPVDNFFIPSEYLNEQNKPQPMYMVTEEGFALLAMGFTGPEALKFKIAFLNAFKQLAAENRRYALATLEIENRRLLDDKEDVQFRLDKFYNMDVNGVQQQRGINILRRFYKQRAEDVIKDLAILDKALKKHGIDADTFNFYTSKLRHLLDSMTGPDVKV